MEKTIWLTTQIRDIDGPVGPEVEYTTDVEEADRLIAIGVAIDPSQRMVVADAADVPAEVRALQQERDALLSELADARDANEAFNAQHTTLLARSEDLSASLTASHQEIAMLTSKLNDASKTIAKLEKTQK